jgi:hypothetical protein
VTEQVPPGGRNQSSYTQASQQNLLRAQPASPPSNWRQQLQQPAAAAAATRSTGPNVWPARQDSINNPTAEPTQSDSRSAAPWRAPTNPARSDVVSVEKAPQGRWQSESDRQVPSHVAEANPVRGSSFSDLSSRRPPAEPSASAFDRAHVDEGRLGHVAQGTYPESGRASQGDAGRGVYLESGSGTYTDAGRRSYGDGYADAGGHGVYQEPNRGGYADDGGRRRVNDERSLGYDEPLRSGNSERITFSDSGRTVYPDIGRYSGEPNRAVDYPENGRRDFRDTVKLVGVARTVQSGVRTPKEEDLVMEVLEEIMGRTLRQPPSPLEVAVPIIWKELMILMAQSVPVEAILRMVLVLVHILERADMVWTVMSRLMVKIRIEAEVLLSQMAHGPLLLLTATEVDTVPRILALEIPLGDQPQPLLLRRGHA